ncbi:MAG: CCA tRNA nucleotidyltransferase, partial [Pseudomonadota bacterium]
MTRIAPDWLASSATGAVMDALGEAFFVGGCVRDALIGRSVADIDISTPLLPADVTARAEAARLRVVPTGIDHGTVTVIAEGKPFEVTTYRKDVATDGRRAVIAFADTLEEDAARRDFTMNALYADREGVVRDPLGGVADLHAGRVRFIGDAAQRIAEDYLRSLRFFRFFAWYGRPEAGLDAEGLAAVAAHLEGLDRLSAERVGAELKRLLAAPDPVAAVAGMAASGVLARLLPGAEPEALGPLVYFEDQEGLSPGWMRRL